MRIIFSPRYSGSTYTLESSPDLIHWTNLTTITTLDSGTERTVTDTAATEGAKFYRVSITKP
jgi:hypothetical protein